jgi:hypothetical protein
MATRSTKPRTKTQLNYTPEQIKSNIRNTLLATPDFPKIYEQVLLSEGYNPKQARNLAARYQKNKEADMPVQPSVKTCTHIKVTGVRCGSPALRGEHFCYFHQRMVRGVRTPPQSRIHPIALLENEESIQASLMEVVNALVRNTVDTKRAELILRALNAAIRNSRRVHFDADQDEMVKKIPDYLAPPKPESLANPAAKSATMSAPGAAYSFTSTTPGQPVTSPTQAELQKKVKNEVKEVKCEVKNEVKKPQQTAKVPEQPQEQLSQQSKTGKASESPRMPHPSRLSKGGMQHNFPQRKPPTVAKPPEVTNRKSAIAT